MEPMNAMTGTARSLRDGHCESRLSNGHVPIKLPTKFRG